MQSRNTLFLTLLLSLGGLAGCSSVEPPKTVAQAEPIEAEAIQQEVDPLQALRQQAEQSRSPQRENYLTQLATILFYQGELEDAAEILKEIEIEGLEIGLLIRRQLLASQLAEKQQAPEQVIAELHYLSGIPLGDAGQAKLYQRLRIDAYRQLGDIHNEVAARISIMAYLDEGMARLNNLQRLMDLALLINDRLEVESDPERRLVLQQQLAQLAGALGNWRQRYAEGESIQPLEGIEEGLAPITTPKQIAVLLPFSSRYDKAAEAVREGILTAYYNTPDSDISLRFYDTYGNKDQAWDAYQRALSEGAEFIIGPLTKDAVNTIAISNEIEVPVLALNHATYPGTIGSGLFQFALSPENEASQVAVHAWNQGLRHPVILVPDNNWGERISMAFQETWYQLGGELLGEQRYDNKANDFSKPIRALFELDISDQRHRDLQKLLRQNIKFTPRRRQDVDFVFIAAQPRQARLIRPQLKFHYAGELPVYSTSHLYQGTPDTQQDRDMDGITFGDTPWTLETGSGHPLRDEILTIWPRANEKHWRLYAMGIDAFELSAFLRRDTINLNYYGETGEMQLTYEGKLYRQLEWATFHRGKPKKIN